MPTLTQESAIAALADARQQHDLMTAQFSQLQTQLTQAEPGTAAFSNLASRAQSLKGKLQQLTTEIKLLEPLAKTEQQRQTEAKANAEKAKAELEAQLAQDALDVDEAIATINDLSDQMAAALETYFEGHRDAKIRLQKAGRRKFSELGYDSRPNRHRLPYVRISGTTANRCDRGSKDLV